MGAPFEPRWTLSSELASCEIFPTDSTGLGAGSFCLSFMIDAFRCPP